VSDSLRTFTKSLFGFDAVVQRVRDDQWDDPSPCEEWTARDVLGHNIMMQQMIGAFARGETPPGVTDTAALVGDDPIDSWNTARDQVLEALDSDGALQRMGATPFGEMPVDRFLRVVAVDPLTHTWDLATATGQDTVLDEGLMEAGLSQLIKAGDAIRGPGAFSAAVEVADDADLMSRFVAITGRQP
jgi:uncharacterized protein (TIGR03086 family)